MIVGALHSAKAKPQNYADGADHSLMMVGTIDLRKLVTAIEDHCEAQWQAILDRQAKAIKLLSAGSLKVG